MNISTRQIIFTCEHGGNHVPPEYRKLFKKKSVLNSHRGYDAGALEVATKLSGKIKVPLVASETTRLLVDLNRSLHHPYLFSGFTRHCDKNIKTEILEQYYLPYRNKVERQIKKIMRSGKPVIHFSIHSFTPKLNNEVRKADIGILYDPGRNKETSIGKILQSLLKNNPEKLIVRRNYPYRGNADGFTTYLRKKYPASKYIGIEIEINQKHVNKSKKWKSIQTILAGAIMALTDM